MSNDDASKIRILVLPVLSPAKHIITNPKCSPLSSLIELVCRYGAVLAIWGSLPNDYVSRLISYAIGTNNPPKSIPNI